MPRGSSPGERRGGRQKGVQNKASIARQAKVAAEGETPLDVMIDNMRFAHAGAAEALAKLLGEDIGPDPEAAIESMRAILNLRKAAQECARDAAPYVHPRLATVAHTGEGGGPLQASLAITFVKPDGAA